MDPFVSDELARRRVQVLAWLSPLLNSSLHEAVVLVRCLSQNCVEHKAKLWALTMMADELDMKLLNQRGGGTFGGPFTA